MNKIKEFFKTFHISISIIIASMSVIFASLILSEAIARAAENISIAIG